MAGYRAGECVVKREVAFRLKAIQQELAKRKLSLKMFDCYRPARATADMVAWSRDGRDTGRALQSGDQQARPVRGSAISRHIRSIRPALRSI